MRRPDLFPLPSDPLDALVRRRLDDRARAAPAFRLPSRRPSFAFALAAAAAVLVALLAALPTSTASAAPAAVVSRAGDDLRHEARAYTVVTEPAEGIRSRHPWLDGRRVHSLRTRGGAFVVKPGPGGTGTWGRGEDGRVWIAPSRRAGAVFDPDEIPASLGERIDVGTADPAVLLQRVLRSCELTFSPPPAPGLTRVVARPRRGGSPTLVSAELDTDAAGRLVRLRVVRKFLGVEAVRTTLTLADDAGGPGFRLADHLDPGAAVSDRTNPGRRLRLLLRLGLGRP